MTETKQVTCPKDIYTVIATGKTGVSFIMHSGPPSGRWMVASALPAPAAADFIPYFRSEGWVELGNPLAATDNVYFYPEGGDADVRVVRG